MSIIKKYLSIFVIILFFCIPQGCRYVTPNNAIYNVSNGQNIFEVGKVIYEISELPFYERLNLLTDEQVAILDVSGNYILLNIFKVNYREVGYSSVSHMVAVFDYEKGEIIDSFKIEDSEFITDGLFVKNGFAYTSIKIDTNTYSSCKLVIKNEIDILEIELGDYDTSGYSDPRIALLDSEVIAFTFKNRNSKEFGIKTIDMEGKITPVIILIDGEKNEWLTNDLYSNGKEFIYFTAIESTGTFLVGDASGIHSKFTLAKNERIYNYCFLEDSRCFMTIETISDNSTSIKECIVRDYLGQTQKRLKNEMYQQYYRLASDNLKYIVGIDSYFRPLLFIVDESEIQRHYLNAPAGPVMFYMLDSNCFLMHYHDYYENTVPALFKLSISEKT